MSDEIRTIIEEWNTASTIIAGLVTSLVALVTGIIAWTRTGPVNRRAARAATRASDANAWKLTQDGSFGLIDRLETRLTATEKEAREAKEEAQQANTQIGALRQDQTAMETELRELRTRYEALIDKVRGVILNWAVIRQSENPPDILNDHN